MADVISLGAIFYIASFVGYFLRASRMQEANYNWAIMYFLVAVFAFFGFYFSTFPYQDTVQTQVFTSLPSNAVSQIVNVTTQYPVANPSTYEFYALIVFTGIWCLLNIILGIYEWLTVMRSDAVSGIKY